MLNGIFTVPYPYVKAEEVEARPQLRKETLEATDVVGFGYESDGLESEAKEFDVRSEGSSEAGGFQTAKTRLEKAQATYEKRVLLDFRYQMLRAIRSEWRLWIWNSWRCRGFAGTVLEGRRVRYGMACSTSRRGSWRTRCL